MPSNLTDVSSFDTVSGPVGSDIRNAASVRASLQTLANRTRFLVERHDALADIDALKAIASPADGLVRLVESKGLYVFDESSVDVEDLPFIVAPTVGSGRWFHATRDLFEDVYDIFDARPNVQVITETNEAVSIPTWAKTVEFLLKGGGGSGADGESSPGDGGGGGGSGYEVTVKLPRNSVPNSVGVTIGSGGDGDNGGDTSVTGIIDDVDFIFRAKGGNMASGRTGGDGYCGGGAGGDQDEGDGTAGYDGGTAGGDGVGDEGGTGSSSNVGASAAGGFGGASGLGGTCGGGGGGGGSYLFGGVNAANGTAGFDGAGGGSGGRGYGAGGGGGGGGSSGPAGTGGAGAPGVVVITCW